MFICLWHWKNNWSNWTKELRPPINKTKKSNKIQTTRTRPGGAANRKLLLLSHERWKQLIFRGRGSIHPDCREARTLDNQLAPHGVNVLFRIDQVLSNTAENPAQVCYRRQIVIHFDAWSVFSMSLYQENYETQNHSLQHFTIVRPWRIIRF